MSNLDQIVSLQTTMLFEHSQFFKKVMNKPMVDLGNILE
jgi:hypothetical protein